MTNHLCARGDVIFASHIPMLRNDITVTEYTVHHSTMHIILYDQTIVVYIRYMYIYGTLTRSAS